MSSYPSIRFVSHEPDAPRSRRVHKACAPCHARKTRCSGDLPCAACRAANRDCSYPPARPASKKRKVDVAVELPPPSPSVPPAPPPPPQSQSQSQSQSHSHSQSQSQSHSQSQSQSHPQPPQQPQIHPSPRLPHPPSQSHTKCRYPFFRFLGPTAIAPGRPFRKVTVHLQKRKILKRRAHPFHPNQHHSRPPTSSSSTSAPDSTPNIANTSSNNNNNNNNNISTTTNINLSYAVSAMRTAQSSSSSYTSRSPTPPFPGLSIPASSVDTVYLHLSSFLPFISRADLAAQISSGTASEILLNIIASLAERINPSNKDALDENDHADIFAERAKTLVLPHLALPNIDTVFALLLIAYHEFGEDRDSGLWMWCGLAIRMATDLGLHKYFPSDDPPDYDLGLRQRVFWSIFQLDRFISSGTGRVSTITEDEITMPPPTTIPSNLLDGINLLSLDDPNNLASSASASSSSSTSLPHPFPYLCHLIILLGRVSDEFNRGQKAQWWNAPTLQSCVSSSSPQSTSSPSSASYANNNNTSTNNNYTTTNSNSSNSTFNNTLANLQRALTEFHYHLPPALNFNVTNFQLYAKRKQSQGFLLLHIWFHALVLATHHPSLFRLSTAMLVAAETTTSSSSNNINNNNTTTTNNPASLDTSSTSSTSSYSSSSYSNTSPLDPQEAAQVCRSSARSISDMIAFAELIDPSAFTSSPFASQPIYMAACASLMELSALNSVSSELSTTPTAPELSQLAPPLPNSADEISIDILPPLHHTTSSSSTSSAASASTSNAGTSLLGMAAQRSFAICRDALSKQRHTWKGVSWLCQTLESRAADEPDVDLTMGNVARVSTRDAGYVNRISTILDDEKDERNLSLMSAVRRSAGIGSGDDRNENENNSAAPARVGAGAKNGNNSDNNNIIGNANMNNLLGVGESDLFGLSVAGTIHDDTGQLSLLQMNNLNRQHAQQIFPKQSQPRPPSQYIPPHQHMSNNSNNSNNNKNTNNANANNNTASTTTNNNSNNNNINNNNSTTTSTTSCSPSQSSISLAQVDGTTFWTSNTPSSLNNDPLPPTSSSSPARPPPRTLSNESGNSASSGATTKLGPPHPHPQQLSSNPTTSSSSSSTTAYTSAKSPHHRNSLSLSSVAPVSSHPLSIPTQQQITPGLVTVPYPFATSLAPPHYQQQQQQHHHHPLSSHPPPNPHQQMSSISTSSSSSGSSSSSTIHPPASFLPFIPPNAAHLWGLEDGNNSDSYFHEQLVSDYLGIQFPAPTPAPLPHRQQQQQQHLPPQNHQPPSQ